VTTATPARRRQRPLRDAATVTDGCAAGSARLASVTGLRVLAGLRPPLTPVGPGVAYRNQEGDGVALDETRKGVTR
jgi:hypothetical protein